MSARPSLIAVWIVQLTLAFAMLLPHAVRAETVVVQAPSGADGANGANGAPGQPGGDGTAGGDALAIADTPNENNTATATGGAGGDGGRGGDGVSVGGVEPGGVGGDGGDGGDASAGASTVGANDATATATGGRPGTLGLGGFGSDGSLTPSGESGVGGDATAVATVDTSSHQTATATATATGGGFNIPSFPGPDFPEMGGSASALAVSHNDGGPAGVGGADATALVQVEDGLSARAAARATTDGSGDVNVRAEVFDIPGDLMPRATVFADAFGSNAGSGDVNVLAVVQSLFDPQTDLHVRAEGHSSGGGDVTVGVSVNALSTTGARVSLHDAVSGSTSGLLTLGQAVGDFLRLGGGDAATSLVATNPGGGDLQMNINAVGGDATFPNPAGNALVGDVIGTSTTGANVGISVRANGGTGHSAATPGTVIQENADGTAGRIYASSNGGDVSVDASFLGGSATVGQDGQSITMDAAVDGDTAGNLTLSQTARGGGGGRPTSFAPGDGEGGDATSILSKTTHSTSLDLRANALAGPGYGDAGDAVVRIDGENSGGSLTVRGVAEAGFARAPFSAPPSVDGGAADLLATLHTSGDGHDIAVFRALQAVGGQGAGSSIDGSATAGGNARSEVVAIAEGDSSVAVATEAIGGFGGTGSSRPGPSHGGDGGDAEAIARAVGGGTSSVSALADAFGGSAGFRNVSVGGTGADAFAHAEAEGLGDVQAVATAVGGYTYAPGGQAGSGLALARANGATGSARADAQTGAVDSAFVSAPSPLQGRYFRAVSEAHLPGVRAVQAQATFAQALPDRDVLEAPAGRAFITGDPLAQDQARARMLNSELDQFFVDNPGAQMLALGDWTAIARQKQPGPASFRTSLEFAVSAAEVDKQIVLGAFDISVLGDEFLSFVYELDVDGVIETHTFDSEAALRSFFDDELFVLGSDLQIGDVVRATFDVVLDRGSRVDMALAFGVVPEPGTGLLVGLGLVAIALRRRRLH